MCWWCRWALIRSTAILWGGVTLKSQDYLRIGKRLAGLDLPTQFVMEGGYAIGALGLNVANVITGFSDSAKA